jgi:hypothetical protein
MGSLHISATARIPVSVGALPARVGMLHLTVVGGAATRSNSSMATLKQRERMRATARGWRRRLASIGLAAAVSAALIAIATGAVPWCARETSQQCSGRCPSGDRCRDTI